MVTQEGWLRGSGEQAVLMIYENLWLLPPSQGSLSEGAAWATLGTQQLCGGYGFVLPPLCFRFSAFLLQPELFYLAVAPRQPPLCTLDPLRGKRRPPRGGKVER